MLVLPHDTSQTCMSEESILAVFNQLAIQQPETEGSSKVLTVAALERCFAVRGMQACTARVVLVTVHAVACGVLRVAIGGVYLPTSAFAV